MRFIFSLPQILAVHVLGLHKNEPCRAPKIRCEDCERKVFRVQWTLQQISWRDSRLRETFWELALLPANSQENWLCAYSKSGVWSFFLKTIKWKAALFYNELSNFMETSFWNGKFTQHYPISGKYTLTKLWKLTQNTSYHIVIWLSEWIAVSINISSTHRTHRVYYRAVIPWIQCGVQLIPTIQASGPPGGN